MNEYDIGKAFRRIENELIKSMIANLKHHKAEEEKEGILWSQWQVEQLAALEKYKKQNKDKFSKEFAEINDAIDGLIKMAREEGNMDQEEEILKAIKKGAKLKKGKGDVVSEFFKVNDRKLNALIKATTDDFKRGEIAILRRANDQYRKIIFDAQVYANAGGTTYEKAVDMATKDFLSRGIDCIEYANGSRHSLADYADMAIKTAVKRAYLTGEGEKRKEWGISTVIMNKRGNACPKCLPFVGKILIDDVWSGGSSDGISPETEKKYPLMSKAIEAGLYHPRCKDSHTTFFEGISTDPDDTYRKKELEQISKQYEVEQKQNYAKKQAEKFERLEVSSLDSDKRERSKRRREQWESKLTKTVEQKEEPSEFSRTRYKELQEKLAKLDGEIEYYKTLKDEADLKFLMEMDEESFKKAAEYEAKIDVLKEQRKPVFESKIAMQGNKAKEAEEYLKSIGVAENIKLSKNMTAEATDVVVSTMKELVVDNGLPPLKAIEYDPVTVQMYGGKDTVAQYNWNDHTMYLGRKLSDPIEYISHRKKAEESYLLRRENKLDEIWNNELKEHKELLSKATTKEEKYLHKKSINAALSNLNPKRKAVAEDARDVLIHEYGHHIHSLASEPKPGDKYKVFGIKDMKARMFKGQAWWKDDLEGKVIASTVSEYAASDPLEAFAESFVAYMKGNSIPDELKNVVEGAIGEVKTVVKSKYSGIMTSGARITDLFSDEAEEFAKMYYREIQSFSTDTRKIAKNLGKSEKEIKQIKQYLFETGFDPDCAIAQSWQRLMNGKNIKSHDRTLIEHELLEMRIKRENPEIEHWKAHEIATRKYNYQKEAEEYYGNLKKHKKDK